jgi:hypothetical protein
VSLQDLDFLRGSWRIADRYLTERLPGCEEWNAFESSMRSWPILGGPANMDGRFADGVGTFLGPDTHNGAPVVCRSSWSDITPDSVRWAQELSADDGTTWETNWTMEMTRIEGAP